MLENGDVKQKEEAKKYLEERKKDGDKEAIKIPSSPKCSNITASSATVS